MSYLFAMLNSLHVEIYPGDARGYVGLHRDSHQNFRLNLPRSIVEEYIRDQIDDPHWGISNDIGRSPHALEKIADLARGLEEFVIDDFVDVSEIGLRRRRGVIEIYQENFDGSDR